MIFCTVPVGAAERVRFEMNVDDWPFTHTERNMSQRSSADAAVPVGVSLLATGIVASVVNGSLLLLLPCVLAAWACWHVARGFMTD